MKSQTQKLSAQAKKIEAIKNIAIKELKTDDLTDKIDHLLDKVNKNQQIDDELQKSIKKLNITQGNNKHLKQLQQLVALKKKLAKVLRRSKSYGATTIVFDTSLPKKKQSL